MYRFLCLCLALLAVPPAGAAEFKGDDDVKYQACLKLAARQPDEAFDSALMEFNGKLDRDRIMDIASSVGIDVTQLQKDMDDPKLKEGLKLFWFATACVQASANSPSLRTIVAQPAPSRSGRRW